MRNRQGHQRITQRSIAKLKLDAPLDRPLYLMPDHVQHSSSRIERHPERVELEARRLQLRAELAAALDEWYELQHKVIPELRAEYERHFRDLEVGIQSEALRCADLARREELFRTKLERGEKISEHTARLVHEMVDREFAKLRERLQNLAEKDRRKRERRRRRLAKQELQELPGIYREIVKKLHPDATDNSADFSKYWQRAQQAYQTRNLARLKSIYDIVCGGGKVKDEMPADLDLLREEVNALQRRVDYEARKNAKLKTEEPLAWRDDLYRDEWIDEHKKSLQAEIDAKTAEAERRHQFLQSILGDDWEARWKEYCKTPEAQERRAFDEDFMEHSYFGGR